MNGPAPVVTEIALGAAGSQTGGGGPASIRVGLSPGSGGRWFTDQIGTGSFALSVLGEVSASLPVFYPTAASALGTVSFSIGNLANIPGTTTLSRTSIHRS